jgi:hypothetical protein
MRLPTSICVLAAQFLFHSDSCRVPSSHFHDETAEGIEEFVYFFISLLVPLKTLRKIKWVNSTICDRCTTERIMVRMPKLDNYHCVTRRGGTPRDHAPTTNHWDIHPFTHWQNQPMQSHHIDVKARAGWITIQCSTTPQESKERRL